MSKVGVGGGPTITLIFKLFVFIEVARNLEEPKTLEEAKKQIALLYKFINTIPLELKWWLDHLGVACRVVRRDYREFLGVLESFKVEVTEIRIAVEEEKRDWQTGDIIVERKIMSFPVNSLANIEMIYEMEEKKTSIEEKTEAKV